MGFGYRTVDEIALLKCYFIVFFLLAFHSSSELIHQIGMPLNVSESQASFNLLSLLHIYISVCAIIQVTILNVMLPLKEKNSLHKGITTY